MSDLAKAIALTAEKFKNKYDKGGEPYILHCLTVMNGVAQHGHEVMMIGVMHDLIEDTDVTDDDLRVMGFSERVVKGVVTMTHLPDEDYMTYIKRISENPDAVLCKREDLTHNSSILRMKSLRKKDFERLEKYFTAFEYLKDC
jgi:(p)ppGpp synthase/HD superfamily hydrolase